MYGCGNSIGSLGKLYWEGLEEIEFGKGSLWKLGLAIFNLNGKEDGSISLVIIAGRSMIFIMSVGHMSITRTTICICIAVSIVIGSEEL